MMSILGGILGLVLAGAAGWLLASWLAFAIAVLPLVMGAVFLRVPVLPTVAVEVAPAPESRSATEVALGQLIAVTDTSTLLLDRGGAVRFVPNGLVRSQTLCPEAARVPFSAVAVHGWPVEENALDWMMPRRGTPKPDVRCSGRPILER